MYSTQGSVIVGQYRFRYRVTTKSEPLEHLDNDVNVFMQKALERDLHLHRHCMHRYWMLSPLCPTSLVTIQVTECEKVKSLDQMN